MKQFRKLEIHNFQSHEHTVVQLSPGLNVFVGASDNGKSAILRALRWVLFNVPRGSDYIRTGTTKCQVTLTMDDGTEIERIRSTGSINRYILRKPDEQELIFEGFGSEVPHEITEIHQMTSVKLDTTQEILLQFGSQLDGPFLLSESPGTKAKMLGFISGAQIIDVALKQANSDRKAILEEGRRTEKNKQSLLEQLKPYENLIDLRRQLDESKKKIARIKELQNRLQQLRKTAHLYTEVKQEQVYWAGVLESLLQLPHAEMKKAELEVMVFQQIQLQQRRTRWKNHQSEKRQCQKQLIYLEKSPEAEARLAKLIDLDIRFKLLYRLYYRYKSVRSEQEQTIQVLKRNQNLGEAAERFQRMIHENETRAQLGHKWKTYQSIYSQKQQQLAVLTKTEAIDQVYRILLPKLEMHTKQMELYREQQSKYIYLHQRVMKGRKYCTDQEEEIKHLTKEYVRLLRVNKKCPTCGSQIHGDVLEHLMSELGGDVYATTGR
ncbi:AAA family ATPase [Thermoactinomyces sp. DSM 45892]|uniref:AAA family ATPase n=1 Tax=Thermoactinomyces sp. DSM 45892 TaxID=1882753 RepID=UPI000898A3AB|nr:AAA family ATPase [Thermoactinomyces sp. DSM 45892]SDY49307.1 AAA domain-containing protein [Thermoactinomyces sp. DSM 45892]